MEIWVGVGGEVGIAEMIPEEVLSCRKASLSSNTHSARLSQEDSENTVYSMLIYA
jgi:hypothetical protein